MAKRLWKGINTQIICERWESEEKEHLLMEIKAPGKIMVVRTAMTFIVELSRLLAAAISFESRATSILRALSCCATRLNI